MEIEKLNHQKIKIKIAKGNFILKKFEKKNIIIR